MNAWLMSGRCFGRVVALQAAQDVAASSSSEAGEPLWPSVLRLVSISFLEGVVMLFIVKVFCAAASISSACTRVLRRVQVLHASLAVHNPKLQDECIKFNHHVERAALGFRAMGFTISYHFGASVLYPVVTGVGVLAMSFLPQVMGEL